MFSNFVDSEYPKFNVGTHKEKNRKRKPRKSRLISSPKEEDNRVEL